ncbi:MAG: transcriptional regulator NrdR [Bdellovibrionales bacterium]
MKCPQCGHTDHRVLETRVHRDEEIRRRRECLKCKLRFSTSESLLVQYPHIVKKDGRREPFNKEKLRRGIQIACKKRPVSIAQIEGIVGRIAKTVLNSPDRELSAHKIGQCVVAELKKADDVAYVRFASVYRSFADVDEFLQGLKAELSGDAEL